MGKDNMIVGFVDIGVGILNLIAAGTYILAGEADEFPIVAALFVVAGLAFFAVAGNLIYDSIKELIGKEIESKDENERSS